MFDQIQSTMSSLENYRMAMNIIKMWQPYRMPMMYAFGALLILTIILFVMKSCWKKTALFLTILTGLVIVSLEGFTMYVENKKQEAIKSALNIPVAETVEKAAEGVMGLVK